MSIQIQHKLSWNPQLQEEQHLLMRGHSKRKEAAHPPPWSTKGHSPILQKWRWPQGATQQGQHRDGHSQRGVLALQDPAKGEPWLLWSSTLPWSNAMGSSWERAKCGCAQGLVSLCRAHQGNSHQEQTCTWKRVCTTYMDFAKNHFTSWQAVYASNNLNGFA